MRYKYIYKHRKNGITYTLLELEAQYRTNFKDYRDFSSWVDKTFEEIGVPIESMYEHRRKQTQATGNKWAKENFENTH